MDITEVLQRMVTTDPGRPRVTWYGPDGERVELSGKVLDNWVAKTANLLVDELDVGPGSRVVLDLPPHWRTLVWLLAAWSAGASVIVERLGGPDADRAAPLPAAEPVEVLVTADPDGPVTALWRPRADRLVVVALPALARSLGAALPDDALDYALEVRTFGDVFVPFVRPARSDPAYVEVVDGAQRISAPYAELLRFASHEAKLDDGVRLLTGGAGTDPLLDLVGPLLADGSVVVHHDPAALDGTALERLAGQEGVTTVRFR